MKLLQQWSRSSYAISAHTWALEKLCREVVHIHKEDLYQTIFGLLKDFMEEARGG